MELKEHVVVHQLLSQETRKVLLDLAKLGFDQIIEMSSLSLHEGTDEAHGVHKRHQVSPLIHQRPLC